MLSPPIDPALEAERRAGLITRRPTITIVPPAGPMKELSWQERLIFQHGKSGPAKVAKHHENAVVVLRYHPAWKDRLSFDEHSYRTIVSDAPWHDSDRPTIRSSTPGAVEWTDTDSFRLASWLRREIPSTSAASLDLSVADCDRAVTIAAEANACHPFRDYLDGLQWDRKPRLDLWLASYLGVADTEFSRKVGAWWLIAAVARTYQPGCMAQYVLILEGEQGISKSRALKTLAGSQWFSDTPIDIGNKDAFLAIQGLVIVELAELDSVIRASGANGNRAKAFFSSATDNYRPPYGRRNVKVPRGCVFAGTVNPRGAYLTDPSGERRYHSVLCGATGPIAIQQLADDRDQLWAEAVARFSLAASADDRDRLPAARWWPASPEEHALCAAEIAPRSAGDAWSDMIETWIDGRDEVSIPEVWKEVLGGAKDKLDQRTQNRIASALSALGFLRHRRRVGNTRQWFYERGA